MEDLPAIEKEMKKIITENIEIERKKVTREEAHGDIQRSRRRVQIRIT